MTISRTKASSLSLTTTSMSELICVTNRKLCKDDFLLRIDRICRNSPKAVILREKDLSEAEYLVLADNVRAICQKHNVLFIAHTYETEADGIHMPLNSFRKVEGVLNGTSVHSVEDAVKAESLGADYVIAGHVFETDCKKGLPGRGLDFVRDVSSNISIPIYAIGGIDAKRYESVVEAGAKGAAIMSGLMTCQDVDGYMSAF